MGCNGAGCDQVLGSSWSVLYGVPVALLGLVLYLVVLGSSLLRTKLGRLVTTTGAILIVLGAGWFLSVQAFVIREFCLYCCLTHGLAVLGAIGMIRSYGGRGLWVALGLQALFSIGQWTSIEEAHGELIQSEERLLMLSRPSPKVEPQLSLAAGNTRFSPALLPVSEIGQADEIGASVVLLYDWTCPYCVQMHQSLSQVELDGERVKVVYLPYAIDDEGRRMHRLMRAISIINPRSYDEIVARVYQRQLEPSYEAVLREVAPAQSEQLVRVYKTLAQRMKSAHSLADTQLAYNEQVIGVNTVPQLIGLQSSLVGPATVEEVRAFLSDEVVLQREVLAQIAASYQKVRRPSKVTSTADRRRSLESNLSEITFDQQVIETERIASGEKATGVFYFTNTGTEPLDIMGLRTGCGCTTGEGVEQRVMPGQRGQFSVTYDSKGKPKSGTHERHVWVRSNAQNVENKINGTLVKMRVPVGAE